jgi:hydrogenase maturation protein HypF
MAGRERHQLHITGLVQGVGFRPCVHRLATELGLVGHAFNTGSGLVVEIEGEAEACSEFLRRVRSEAPPHAEVRDIAITRAALQGGSDFQILASNEDQGSAAAEAMPDLAPCGDCLSEIFDPANRRHAYPFTNCTQCGPRFSITLALPYDRERTTLRGFVMCAKCREEYADPGDRRFHAQPNACPQCGPQLAFADPTGRVGATREEALEVAARAIVSGQIIAVKGVGGFQLIADARYANVVQTLRDRKHRPAKPLALMMPDLVTVRQHCELSRHEEELLASPKAPIVILRRRNAALPGVISPGNPTLGVMLPSSPLHHLLLRRLGFPVVATSGNLSGEPLCIDNDEAFQRLRGIADGFLVHDRPIARPVDDSVVRVALGSELVLRCARGHAPLTLPGNYPPVLALGGDQKCALAVSGPFGIRCGQHIGDLETETSQQSLLDQSRDFPALCGVQVGAVACDLHPGYHSSRIAAELGLPVLPVQHHHAHIAACLVEHDLYEEVLGVVWDGTGYGTDGTIWGGEFLLATRAEFSRVAHLRPFPLPGGERAIRQPRYAALGLLHEAGISIEDTPLAAAFTREELAIARTQIERSLNTPLTSSAGRLFDAVAALLGLCWRSEFEGQAAMQVEFAADPSRGSPAPYPFDCEFAPSLDWAPMIRAMLEDLQREIPIAEITARFMETLADVILRTARLAQKQTVVLSGGCFQNLRLLETTVAKLHEGGFIGIWPGRLPPNDGGLAVGQAAVAAAQLDDSTR